MSKSKINFKCIVGTKLGYIKVINGFNLKEESQINLHSGPISQIRKFNDAYYVSAEDSIHRFEDFSAESPVIVYNPSSDVGDVVKFDFTDNGLIVCYKDEVHVVKDEKLFSSVTGGIYSDFCLLRDNHFAVGGENTELTVYNIGDLEKAVYVGKTPSNKALSLPAKIHITSLAQDTENNNIVYCGTQFNKVQLYDIRSNQRKAQSTANFYLDYAVTKLTALAPQKVIAASARGILGIIDFRYFPKNNVPAKNVLSKFEKFKENATGIVSDMAIGNGVKIGDNGKKTTDILATTSFDRQFRVYDIKNRELLNKMYLGSKGTCVMIDSVNQCADEDLWEDLERMDNGEEGTKRRIDDDGDNRTEKKRAKNL